MKQLLFFNSYFFFICIPGQNEKGPWSQNCETNSTTSILLIINVIDGWVWGVWLYGSRSPPFTCSTQACALTQHYKSKFYTVPSYTQQYISHFYTVPCFTKQYISTLYTVPSYSPQSFTGCSRIIQFCIYSVPFHAQQYLSIFYTTHCTVGPDLKISLALYSEPLSTVLLYRKLICIFYILQYCNL